MDNTITFNSPTPQELKLDAARGRRVRARLSALGLVVVEKGTLGVDAWRYPVRLTQENAEFSVALFAKVEKAGASLVVVELFDNTQMQSYFVDIPRVRLRGIWRWPAAARRQLVISILVFFTSATFLFIHVYPLWKQYS
jgi:hypothetical protein